MSGLGPASCWVAHKRLESWAKAAKDKALATSSRILDNGSGGNGLSRNNSTESIAKEDNTSGKNTPSPSRRFNSATPPGGSKEDVTSCKQYKPSTGRTAFYRSPSVSAPVEPDIKPTKQAHHGSSPQIRAFGPDGGKIENTAKILTTRRNSRSPSPLRSASLDVRSLTPGSDIQTTPSLCGSAPSTPPTPSSPNSQRSPGAARCLSPLLLPSRSPTPDFGTHPPVSPLGTIQPDLYTKIEGPIFISKLNEELPYIGKVHARIRYDTDRSDFIVHLIEALDLVTNKEDKPNNPFIRVAILPPIDNRKRQSVIYNNDSNPLFDTFFKFPITYDDLKTSTLAIQLFDCDGSTRTDIVGEIRLKMDDIIIFKWIELWGEISQIKKPLEESQEVFLSINYLSSAERLSVLIVKARNLYNNNNQEIEVLIKINLYNNEKKIKKRRTSIQKGPNPEWNESFAFPLTYCNMQNARLEVTALNNKGDLKGTKNILGSLNINLKELLDSDKPHNRTICPRWHQLQ